MSLNSYVSLDVHFEVRSPDVSSFSEAFKDIAKALPWQILASRRQHSVSQSDIEH